MPEETLTKPLVDLSFREVPCFDVTIVRTTVYQVEATTMEEALQRVLEGLGSLIDKSFESLVEPMIEGE